MIFVNSMSDLFHETIPDDAIASVFETMAQSLRHVFQVLTKRPHRMARFVETWLDDACWPDTGCPIGPEPLPNVWLGVSCEDQETAGERILHLLQTPAPIRFLSCEPLLGRIDLMTAHRSIAVLGAGGIDWVIVGGESGPKARPMHRDWPRAIRDQCVEAGVPFFFKQWGEYAPSSVVFPSPSPPNDWFTFDDGMHMYRVGKKHAGRLLDGREWNEMPKDPVMA